MDRDAIIAAMIFGGSGSGGGGGADAPLVVNFSKSGNNIVCDTSIADILTASAAGKIVYGIVPNSIADNSRINGTVGIFRLEGTATSLNYVNFYSSSVFPTDGYSTPMAFLLRLNGSKVLFNDVWTYTAESVKVNANVTPANDSPTLTSIEIDDTTYKIVDKGEPYEVEFTITGQPSGISYPVSVTDSLANIYDAFQRGDRVFGSVALSAGDVALGTLSSVAPNGNLDGYVAVSFDIIGITEGMIVLGHAVIRDDGNSEVATLEINPLSTAQMSYDSGTQTLAIVDPLA